MSENSEKTLGLVELPPGTFEHDHHVNEKYQAFSRELLRLSIAGIGAIGLIVFAKADSSLISTARGDAISFFGFLLLLSAISFFLGMAASLVHVYVSTDAEAFHLRYLRMQTLIPKVTQPDNVNGICSFSDYWFRKEIYKNLTSPNDKAWKEREIRDYLLTFSGRVLFWAAFCLGTGGFLFVMSLLFLLIRK